MKIFLDTNILLDALTSREPYNEMAEAIILMITRDEIEGFITANSVADIFYIMRK